MVVSHGGTEFTEYNFYETNIALDFFTELKESM